MAGEVSLARPGVYGLTAGGRVLYVGMSRRSMRGRLITHFRHFARYLGEDAGAHWRDHEHPEVEELLYLYRYLPPLNSETRAVSPLTKELSP